MKASRVRFIPSSLTGGEKGFFIGQSNSQRGFFQSYEGATKAQSNLISPDQTLYSFRHTGAISVYEKTRNLRTVQTVMGHASMAVTLGYLRGLEVCALNADEMPELTLSVKDKV